MVSFILHFFSLFLFLFFFSFWCLILHSAELGERLILGLLSVGILCFFNSACL